MKIAEELDKWTSDFQNGWLKEFKQHNRINWDLYSYIKNSDSPQNAGIKLSSSKLLLISSAGGYFYTNDIPFDAGNPLGDYSIRTFPLSVNFNDIRYSHDHYNTAAVKKDAQVLLPLHMLKTMVEEKIIGEMCETVISFMGYQPDVNKVITETIPKILRIVEKEQVDTVLLVPS
ncbi:MAG: glycine/sarcosine/betaine reductase selenoprotein B family protein [Candidatus Neomarinimicrobiota bacterium]